MTVKEFYIAFGLKLSEIKYISYERKRIIASEYLKAKNSRNVSNSKITQEIVDNMTPIN